MKAKKIRLEDAVRHTDPNNFDITYKNLVADARKESGFGVNYHPERRMLRAYFMAMVTEAQVKMRFHDGEADQSKYDRLNCEAALALHKAVAGMNITDKKVFETGSDLCYFLKNKIPLFINAPVFFKHEEKLLVPVVNFAKYFRYSQKQFSVMTAIVKEVYSEHIGTEVSPFVIDLATSGKSKQRQTVVYMEDDLPKTTFQEAESHLENFYEACEMAQKAGILSEEFVQPKDKPSSDTDDLFKK